MSIQLLLFEETWEEKIDKRVTAMEERLEKQGKAPFVKMGELKKKIDYLTHELEVLKMAMCKYGKE